MEENKEFSLSDFFGPGADLEVVQIDKYKAVVIGTNLKRSSAIGIGLTMIARAYYSFKEGETTESINAMKQTLREHLEEALQFVDSFDEKQ